MFQAETDVIEGEEADLLEKRMWSLQCSGRWAEDEEREP
jgi:hypothetical protein